MKFNVKVSEFFTLEKFNELENLVRANENNKKDGKLYAGDTFDCNKEMYEYLTGANKYKRAFVELNYIVEDFKITPEKVIESAKNDVEEVAPIEKEKKTRKKKSKK